MQHVACKSFIIARLSLTSHSSSLDNPHSATACGLLAVTVLEPFGECSLRGWRTKLATNPVTKALNVETIVEPSESACCCVFHYSGTDSSLDCVHLHSKLQKLREPRSIMVLRFSVLQGSAIVVLA